MTRFILPTLGFNQQRQVLNELAAADRVSNADRLHLYRTLGLAAGAKVEIASNCFFTHTDLSTVSLGSEVFINHFVYFDNGALIEIGDRVDIGDRCRLLTGTHAIGSAKKRAGYGCIRKPINIGVGSWLGSGVTVCREWRSGRVVSLGLVPLLHVTVRMGGCMLECLLGKYDCCLRSRIRQLGNNQTGDWRTN